MVSEAPEQTGVTTVLTGDPEIDGAPTGEPTPPAAAGSNVPATEPAVPETPPTPPAPLLDLSTPEGIKQAAEQNEALAAYLKQQQADAENRGRQKRESELRRDQGSTARAKQVEQLWAAKYGVTFDEEDQRAIPLVAKLNEDTLRVEMYGALLEQAASIAPEADAQAIRALADGLEEPDALQKVAQSSLNALQARAKADGRAEALAEFDPAKIQPGTPEFAKLVAWSDARIAAEVAARELEARSAGRTNAPTTPVGAAAAVPESGSETEPQQMTWEQLQVAYGNGRVSHPTYKAEAERRGMRLRA